MATLRALPLADAQLAVGLRVRHEQFGPGVVEAVIGTDPARARVEVRFGGHGKKSLVLQYTRLRRADAGEGTGA